MCENCINFSYVELVHGDFQVYVSLQFFVYHSVNFWESDIVTPTKNLNLSA